MKTRTWVAQALHAEQVGGKLARDGQPRAPPVEHRARLAALPPAAAAARDAAGHARAAELRPLPAACATAGAAQGGLALGETHCCNMQSNRHAPATFTLINMKYKLGFASGIRGFTAAGAGLVGAVGAPAAAAPIAPRGHVLLKALDVGARAVAGGAVQRAGGRVGAPAVRAAGGAARGRVPRAVQRAQRRQVAGGMRRGALRVPRRQRGPWQ